MLMIRLQRIGKKKQPTYRLVISEKARDTQANALEILGHYSPTQDPKVLELKTDRIKHWISMGAQTSETVNNLLIKEGVIEGKKAKSVSLSNKRRGKLDAKKAESDQKAKDADEAKKAEAEAKAAEKKAAAEAPAEEPKEEAPVEEKKSEEKAEEAPKEETPEEKPAEETPAEVPAEEVKKEEKTEA